MARWGLKLFCSVEVQGDDILASVYEVLRDVFDD